MGRLRLLFLLISASQVLHAQFANYLIDSARVGGVGPHHPAVAIHPKNINLVAAGSSRGWVYLSTNQGTTWSAKPLLCPLPFGGSPFLQSDFKGKFFYGHLAFEKEGTGTADRIVVQSAEDGKIWDAGIITGMNTNARPEAPAGTVGRDGTLYTVWTEVRTENEKCTANIMISKANAGKKFTRAVRLTAADGSCSTDARPTGASVAVTNDGKIFVTWAQNGKIFLDRSWDGGNIWLTQDIQLTQQPGGYLIPVPGMGMVEGAPQLVIDQSKNRFSGALYLLWTDTGDGHADIWFMRSFNMGDNWTSPMRIHNDDGTAHQFAPAMAVDPVTGYIYIVFYDRRNHHDNQTDVYLAWSVDNGSSFKNVKISATPFTPQTGTRPGKYTAIAAYKGLIVPLWTRLEGTASSIWVAPIQHTQLEQAVKQ
jgi:hypothetical protein